IISTVENWAPLDELPRVRSDDTLSCTGIPRPPTFIYAGSLGYKHNPDLLLAVASELSASVLVFSEGGAANSLKREAQERGIGNLIIRDWVPFDRLPAVLSEGQVLMAIIDPDAGVFSVPSKVLTYLCMGRPILASIPAKNSAARLIIRNGAGLVSSPDAPRDFVQNAERLSLDPLLRTRMGAAAREY